MRVSRLRRVLASGGRSDQRGIATVEFLAAMVILAFTVGGILAATMAAGVISEGGNQKARQNVLMTSFAESIKGLGYDACAGPSDYQHEFDTSSDTSQLRGTDGASFEVVAVQIADTSGCPAFDSGIQNITLRIELNGESLERVIVKRTPDPELQPLDFRIKDPIQHSETDNPIVLWEFHADGSTKVFQYEWFCDAGDWLTVNHPVANPSSYQQQDVTVTGAIPAPDFITSSPSAYDTVCDYEAPAVGEPQANKERTIALRITEDTTNRTGIAGRVFTLPTTPTPHNRPIAQIDITSNPQCLSVPETAKCTYNVPISFRSSAPPPPDTPIILWKWNFGDGTPDFLCTASVADPTGQSCINVQHTYLGGGEFPVTLTVTDGFGTASLTATRNVFVNGPIKVRPTIQSDVSAALTATPNTGVSPQIVSFNAAGSHADGFLPGQGTPPGGIANYYWEFGPPGAIQSGPNLTTPTYTYPASTQLETYTAKVTVTDVNGVTNFATVTVTLNPLVPPIGIRNTQAKGDIPLFRDAYFDFQWTNVPRTVGDSIQYVIRIRSGGGFCGFLGVGVNYRDFVVNAGAAGTIQTYRAQFNSSPDGFNGVCATDSFNFQAMTRRTNPACPGGVCESIWSPLQPLDPTFF